MKTNEKRNGAIPVIIAAAIAAMISAVIYYFTLPAWNISSVGMWVYILIVLALFLATESIAFASDGARVAHEFLMTGFDAFGGTKGTISKRKKNVLKALGIAMLAVLIILIFGGLFSSTIFNASSYSDLIFVETGDFDADISEAESLSSLAVVDMQTAESVGDRTLATAENASWYEVDDEYNLIEYGGTYYRISSVCYSGFFKWCSASSVGLPGYVLVNAVTQEATLVSTSSPMLYSPDAYLSYDLTRHLRAQYPTYIFGDSYFEIDDDGNPYWITSVRTARVGLFGAMSETAFVITDACTGESTEYAGEDIPEWVDHAYSLEYLTTAAYWHYEFVDGWFNHAFSQTGVYRTSYYYSGYYDDEYDYGYSYDGYNTAITSSGEVVFYVGLSPANGAESNIGFLLLSPSTGTITYYACAGAEESSAQSAAEGVVQNLGYDASFPTVVNISGEPTYFMVLKDNAGLIRRYALSNIADYTKVVVSETFDEARLLYLETIGAEIADEPTGDDTLSLTSKIASISTAEISGTTVFIYEFEDADGLFVASISLSVRQITLEVGDTVTVSYAASGEDGVYNVSGIEW
ncbi:MAG: hypothetical protein LUH54_00745 [Firmicutes bacterium]|nr:hypothetical protein [Bacillota bacterium]